MYGVLSEQVSLEDRGAECMCGRVLTVGCELLVTNLCCFAVYADGSICLDILQNRWSPTYDVSSILTSIQVRHNLLIICGI